MTRVRIECSHAWVLSWMLVSLAMPATAHAQEPSAPAASDITVPPASRVLGLAEALRIAARVSPARQRARAEMRAAEGRKDQTRSVLLPQVIGTAGYTRARGSGAALVTPRVTTTSSAPYDRFNVGVTASQVLWDYGAIERLRAAGFELDATRATERAAQLQTELDVRSAFFDARAAHALIDVQRETYENQRIHQREIESFVRVGVRPEIDLIQAKTDVANARVALLQAQNRYRIAKATLRQVIGWDESSDFEVGDDELPEQAEEGRALGLLVQTAFENRPELRSLILSRQSAEASLEAARGGYIPTLAAEGGIAKVGTEIDSLATTWDVGVVLTWRLFEGGLTNGQVDEAKALAEVQVSEWNALRLQVQFDVEQAKAVIEDNRASLSAAQESRDLARSQLYQAEGRYRQGVSNIVELRDAQLAVTSSSAQLVTAQLNVFTARAQLIAALGAP